MTHCANNYGPYQLPEKLIPLMITNVLRGRKLPVYGDGLQRRDWLHVRDHDISARHEVTNLDIVARVLAVLDRDPAEWVEHVADRPNHDRRYLINPEKIEKQLGWAPTIEFESALADTVRWYVDNEPWWIDVFERKGELQINWA